MKYTNPRSSTLLCRGVLAASLLGALSLVGCAEDRPPMEFVHDERSGLEGIEVTGRSWKELNGSVAFEFSINNTTSAEVRDVEVILNDEYRCGLEELAVYEGFSAGAPPHGRSTLRPNETLEFKSSHDVPNGWIMRNAAQQPLPNHLELSSVGLEAAGSSGRWVRPGE